MKEREKIVKSCSNCYWKTGMPYSNAIFCDNTNYKGPDQIDIEKPHCANDNGRLLGWSPLRPKE